jgi:phenylpropionate dioxygenase-like ring-hydroxylating dioxygenase large terminal subunit
MSLKAGIQCGYHGVKSDSAGQCCQSSGRKLIAQDARIRSLRTVETDQLARLWMGNPTLADPINVIDFRTAMVSCD